MCLQSFNPYVFVRWQHETSSTSHLQENILKDKRSKTKVQNWHEITARKMLSAGNYVLLCYKNTHGQSSLNESRWRRYGNFCSLSHL